MIDAIVREWNTNGGYYIMAIMMFGPVFIMAYQANKGDKKNG